MNEAYYETIGTLSKLGKKRIPKAYIPSCHLIYSSPATLAYNSPGAIGFGVKRAGLVIPESVMLLVSPQSCGRNSTILSSEEGYADRMFYLLMSETDLVTGRHLKKIPQAIHEIIEICDPKPKVVVICITCVDALLATDLESICQKAQEECDVLVVPSYMYALEREGRKPPMVAIRQTIYSLLERKPVDPKMINILGFFSSMDNNCELFPLLRKAGIETINQVAEMRTLHAYYEMGAANFNLVLDPESTYAAEDLKNRLGMPYIELPRLYQAERIHHVYQLFGKAIGVSIDDEKEYAQMKKETADFALKYTGKHIAIGEMCNANPFELACALTNMGLIVPEIFANVTEYDFPYINRLAEKSPETKVYTGISPSMIHYHPDAKVDCAIGKDAVVNYHKGIDFNSEKQIFGYYGLHCLLQELEAAL